MLDHKYYNNALSYILDKTAEFVNNKQIVVLYFCEEQSLSEAEEIIDVIRQPNYSFVKYGRANPALEDWEQMLLMSLCHHNIIANSTFSWWGAYLNTNTDRIVCYPEEWFTPQSKNDTSDLFPDDWTKISNG